MRPRGLQRDHRTAADFTAGAGGRRDGDEGGESGPVGFLVEIGEVELRAFDEQASGFACVQRTAAAKRDHAVAAVVAKGLGGLAHVLLNRVGMHAGIKEPVDSLRLQSENVGQGTERRGSQQTRVGNHERSANPEPL